MVDISIKIEDSGVQQALKDLAGKVQNLRPMMKIIGEYLVKSSWERFNRGGPAPDGSPWKALSPAYAKKKKGKGILRESDGLRDSIRYHLLSNTSVAVGTNKVYAAIQQLGGKTSAHEIHPINKAALFWFGAKHPVKSVKHPGSKIPARPYLGVSSRDSSELVAMIGRYLMRG